MEYGNFDLALLSRKQLVIPSGRISTLRAYLSQDSLYV